MMPDRPFGPMINGKRMRKMMTMATIAVLMSVAGMAVATEPGDTVKFVATDKGDNAESIKGMFPADATPFLGKNNENVAVMFDKPGARCQPHYGVGMVALIVVGTPGSLAEAKAAPLSGKAKQAFAALFEKLSTQAAASQ